MTRGDSHIGSNSQHRLSDQISANTADGAYDRGTLMSHAAYRDVVIAVVRGLENQKGFRPLPRRWGGAGLRLEPKMQTPVQYSNGSVRRQTTLPSIWRLRCSLFVPLPRGIFPVSLLFS